MAEAARGALKGARAAADSVQQTQMQQTQYLRLDAADLTQQT